MRFSIYQESKIGGRKVNQDRMGYLYTRDCLLMVVADGMGGHARGEVAAQLTVQTVAAMFEREAKPRLANPARFLENAIQVAHRELHRYRAEHGMPEAPRTTIVVCVVQHGVATWAHAGDSRLYWIRDGAIVDRTLDHSRVHHLVSSGLIRAEDAKDHPERNRIFNCLGADIDPVVQIGKPATLRFGDVLLLCTDGLWGSLSDREVVGPFTGQTVMRAVPDLVETALAAGGPEADNCTAMAMSWAGAAVDDWMGGRDFGVSTREIPEGAIASTVQMPRAGEDPGVLTDQQIDEAISEIQNAIQRSSKWVRGQ